MKASVMLAIASLLVAGSAARPQEPPLSTEAAVHELFGGELVIGEVPEIVSTSLPLVDGVEVSATHVLENRFIAVLSSKRDLTSLLLEYSGLLSELGWKPVSVNRRSDDELAFCTPENAHVRILPRPEGGTVRARVELELASGACRFASSIAELARAETPARQLLEAVPTAPGCSTRVGGRSSNGPEASSATARVDCATDLGTLSVAFARHWRTQGWIRRDRVETTTGTVSTWEVPQFHDRRWYATVEIARTEQPATTIVTLSLAALAAPAP